MSNKSDELGNKKSSILSQKSKITIKPMTDFPYEIDQRRGVYLDRDSDGTVKVVDSEIIKSHYCVAYEGSNVRIMGWSKRRRKRLPNLGSYFEGSTAEEKRQIIWQQLQKKALSPELIEFAENFRGKPLFIWYLSSYDLPIAQLIKRFLEYYWFVNASEDLEEKEE